MQSDKDSKSVTVTGCLRAGEGPGTFVLNNAKAAGMASKDSPAGAPGTAGTAGTATPPAASTSMESKNFALSGSPTGVTLSDHVGHTVQITGVPAASAAPSAPTGATAPTTPAAPGASTGMASKAAQPTLNVTAFSMVSGSCSM